MNALYDRSVRMILDNQHSSGAFVASPNFDTYRHCWFRDGAFIAYAMNLAGEHGSSERFHQWAATVVNRRADIIRRAIAKARLGEELTSADILHTRYSVTGEIVDNEWPNFQLDGFGTWLWALGEHTSASGSRLPAEWLRASKLVADYLVALWRHPCYDCWEELPDKIHPYTLAAIYAGLEAQSDLSGTDHSATLKQIPEFLHGRAVRDGHLVKFIGSEDVDAGLIALAIPYGVIRPDDPLMCATVDRIEAVLCQGGGLHRYPSDTYYGGGEWVLLTAWLGWYYTQVGEWDKARMALKWVEDQADAHGQLPEQIPATLNAPEFLEPWRKRWGEVAKPLLWSHAKYMILVTCANRE
jgi:GH15 family glucan-1,4-alpha-glucosidase